MSTNWRISSFNGALLAAYFIPTWTIVAFKIMVSPVHAFYERPNIAVALFISDHLHLAAMPTIRAAWLLALGQWDEFRLHVRAALTEGGFTPDDIKEIVLQQTIYCGVPAANHAMREASAVLQELGLLKG